MRLLRSCVGQLTSSLNRRSTILVVTASTGIALTGAGVAIAATTFKSGGTVTRTIVLTQDTTPSYSGVSYVTVGSARSCVPCRWCNRQ